MNGSAVRAFGNRAAAVGESLWPATVKVAGGDYPAEVPSPREGYVVGDGRQELDSELVVKIRKAEMPAEPETDQPLEYDGTVWWIISVREAQLEDRWLIRCEPRN